MKCPETHTYETDVMLGCAMPKTEPMGVKVLCGATGKKWVLIAGAGRAN